MQAREVDVDRLVGMIAAGVLHGVGVDGELMDLTEDDSVRILSGENFALNRPAFR